MPGTGGTQAKPTPSSISGGSGDHIQGAAMLPRGTGSRHGFKHHHAAPWQRAWKHRTCPTKAKGTQGPETPSQSQQPGPGTHRAEQSPLCSEPSSANPRPSPCKHPNGKERDHHKQRQTRATAAAGQGVAMDQRNLRPPALRSSRMVPPTPPSASSTTITSHFQQRPRPGPSPAATRLQPRSQERVENQQSHWQSKPLF